ncbi:hypothetical protein [Castellaniella sp.]|uniref:hypothetical protein n=1 Tax=Castellaniella sp. TaxID=1955812 RepID=UPI003C74045D
MKSHRPYSDHEIARYVLGLDMGPHTQEIQARLARDNAAAARALKWETYFLDIVDALPASPPPPSVLAQLEASLSMEPYPPQAASAVPDTDAADAHPPEVARTHVSRNYFKQPRAWRTLGLIVAVAVLMFLTWAALKPLPDETQVQQTVHLEASPATN